MSRPFNEILVELGGQDANEELTGALGNLVRDVRQYGKSGSLALTLKVDPNGEDSVTVSYKITEKPPEPPRSRTVFYADNQNALRRNDPRQTNMNLRPVEEPEPNFEEVNG